MKNRAVIICITIIAFLATSDAFAKRGPKPVKPPVAKAVSCIILDKQTNETLAGVMIQIPESNMKLYTNVNGEVNFQDLTPGNYKVKLHCISYEEKEYTLKVKKSASEQLRIFLNPVTP